MELEANLYEVLHKYDAETTSAIAEDVHDILHRIGEDPEREGLVKTPERVAKAYQYLTHGYGLDPKAILTGALFAEDYSEMILVKDIEIYSLCEHHMIPFFGKAHVAYIYPVFFGDRLCGVIDIAECSVPCPTLFSLSMAETWQVTAYHAEKKLVIGLHNHTVPFQDNTPYLNIFDFKEPLDLEDIPDDFVIGRE